MLSRVADAIYWMSRYIERAENVARFVDVNWHLMLGLPSGIEQWMPLVYTTGDDELFLERYETATRENVINFLTFDKDYTNSIYSCVSAARENARSVRETISTEMWEQLNTFYLLVQRRIAGRQAMHVPHEFYQDVKRNSQLFNGITAATMTHGEAYHFARLGRMLERADKTSRILDVKYYMLLPSLDSVGSPIDGLHWAALLHSASAFEMYRKCHGQVRPESIVEFLVLDPDFPRAIRHCLLNADQSLHAISGTTTGTYRNSAERRLGQLCAEISFATVEEIIQEGLHEFLDRFQTKLNDVGGAIHDRYFSFGPVDEELPVDGDVA